MNTIDMYNELKTVYLSSFNGNLCTYTDKVIADKRDVSDVFAGQDCYASNYQKDVERDYNDKALMELASSARHISIYYHDRADGHLEYEVHYSKENDKWKCHTKYHDDYQYMLG